MLLGQLCTFSAINDRGILLFVGAFLLMYSLEVAKSHGSEPDP